MVFRPAWTTPTSLRSRKMASYFFLFLSLTLFLICSNTILHLKGGGSCGHYWSSPSSAPDPFLPSSYTPTSQSYVFVREANLITRLAANSNTSKTSIDLLLNIRKLALFAAHELNELVGCGRSPHRQSSKCAATWWTNPLDTMALKTRAHPSLTYTDHDLTFIAEPEGVPFFVRIRQFNATTLPVGKLELAVIGKFYRLDGERVAAPKSNSTTPSNPDTLDPELPTWPKDKSFLVMDYLEFGNPSMYKISPGGTMNQTKVERFCSPTLKMLVMVSSAPKHFEQRRAIRETYGAPSNLEGKGVQVVFLFGLVEDSSLQAFLEEEAKEFNDMIQADFTDSYHNLSLSHLSMYNWIQVTCQAQPLPKYVLKADDDFLLNIELALRVAFGNPQYEMIGVPYCGTAPVRSLAYITKYYTPRYMYMAEKYVGYLSGVAYVFRTDIIPRMLQLSYTTPMIHMDDVFVTGLIARQLNFYPMGSTLFTYGKNALDPCSAKKMVSSYVLGVEDMRAQWTQFIQPKPDNCSLDYIQDLIHINPFRPQDLVGCVLAE